MKANLGYPGVRLGYHVLTCTGWVDNEDRAVVDHHCAIVFAIHRMKQRTIVQVNSPMLSHLHCTSLAMCGVKYLICDSLFPR